MSLNTQALLGHWSGTVGYGGTVDEYDLEFAADGTATMQTPESAGSGTWAAAQGGGFTFEVTEKFKLDENGALPAKVLPGAAYIRIEVGAVLDGATFTGTGTASIFTAEDVRMHAMPIETSAEHAD